MSTRFKVVFLAVWTLLSVALYLALYMLVDYLMILIYLVIAGVFLISFTVLNRGFGKLVFSPELTPTETKRRKAAQLCLMLAIPTMVLPMIDYLLMSFDYTLMSVLLL
ncbi:MAG TPA: hypothetical protein PLT66_06435, partial [Bacillota bacterium]|nr:hypothetical protein [Bacillota bacterium]